MPLVRSRQATVGFIQPGRRGVVAALTGIGCCASAVLALADSGGVSAVRSKQVELQFQADDVPQDAVVELWYKRDRATTWQHAGSYGDMNKPILFEAPAEGMYGFYLDLRTDKQHPLNPPDADTQPQRQVFIDYTPPLAQWDGVEPDEAFASRRVVRLKWTAFDAHLSSRPVSLWYQSSVEQTWRPIEQELPNSGQYDWTAPAQIAGQITLKLAVRDLGGHVVERLHGPVSIDRWTAMGIVLPRATQPAEPAAKGPASRPAVAGIAATSPAGPLYLPPAARKKVDELYSRGHWHASRSEYSVAAERFREALEVDPTHVPSLYELGIVHYYQKDYPKAIETLRAVLAQDSRHEAALRGIHESYIAQRQYAKSYETLLQLTKLNGKNAQTWLDLGDVLFIMERQEDAREMWGKALNADPSAADVVDLARIRLSKYGATSPSQANNIRPRG